MSAPKQTSIARTPDRSWLTRLNISVTGMMVCHLLIFPKPRDWNAYPPGDVGTLTQHDTAIAPRRTLKVLRWLDTGINCPPVADPKGNVYIASTRWMADSKSDESGETPKLLALDGKSGAVLWEHPLEGDWTSDVKQDSGFVSATTGKWVGQQHYWRQEMLAATTGQESVIQEGLVRRTVTGKPMIFANPFSHGDSRACVGDDPVTGMSWKTAPPLEPDCDDFLVAGHILYIVGHHLDERTQRRVFSIEARDVHDGAIRWRLNPMGMEWRFTQICLSQDRKTLFYTGIDASLTAVDSAMGTKRWLAKLGSEDFSPYEMRAATGPGGVVVAFDPTASDLWAYDENTGKILWQKRATGHVLRPRYPSNPIIGRDGTVYAVLEEKVTAINSKTGAILWSAEPPSNYDVSTDCAEGPDGTIYFGAKNYFREPSACVIAVKKGRNSTTRRLPENTEATPIFRQWNLTESHDNSGITPKVIRTY